LPDDSHCDASSGLSDKSINPSNAAPRIILASMSPRRRELLARLGVSFDVVAANVAEAGLPGEAPLATAQRLALEKAEHVAKRVRGHATPTEPILVLGADTVVMDGNRQLGKPADATDAAAMIRRLAGHTHQVITGVAMIDLPTGRRAARSETTDVHLRLLSEEEISRYVATGDPLDKAGGYAIQNRAFHPVELIAGCYSNVVGLPLCLVADMLVERGVAIEPSWTKQASHCACARLAEE
jgi:septum formation protein